MPETMRLFIRSNPFFRGMVRVIDIGCTFNRRQPVPEDVEKTDWEKIGEDWLNVGRDMNSAINRYKAEYENVK